MHDQTQRIGGRMKAPDENDKLRAGKLDPDLEKGTKLVSINGGSDADKPRVLSVREILEAAATRAKSGTAGTECTTGHYQLDIATGGIRPGHSWIFAAESNWGKSTWLVMVADENLRRGKRVLIVSAEDDESIYGARLLARRSEVAASSIRRGNLGYDERERIDGAIDNAESLPVYLDARGKTAEWTAREVDKLIVSEGIDLVAYDYLQEFTSSKPQENHRLTVKHIAGILRKVVKLRGKASVIMSQITESETTQKRAYPTRNQIRDCRDVANAAEVILMGYTPEKAIEDSAGKLLVPSGAKAIWVDKVKDGPKGFAVWTEWDDRTASFNAVQEPARRADGFEDGFDNSEERYR